MQTKFCLAVWVTKFLSGVSLIKAYKHVFMYLLCKKVRYHGAKKVSFTACHLGKLLPVCTSPRVFLTSPKNCVISSIDYSSSVISISQKTSLALLARTEFTSLIAKSTSPRLTDTTFFAHWVSNSILWLMAPSYQCYVGVICSLYFLILVFFFNWVSDHWLAQRTILCSLASRE